MFLSSSSYWVIHTKLSLLCVILATWCSSTSATPCIPLHPHAPNMKDLSKRLQIGYLKLLFSLYIKKKKIMRINWKGMKKRRWMFKLETFLLTQDLPLIQSGKKERKQNSVWEKWEKYIIEIWNLLLKYFSGKEKWRLNFKTHLIWHGRACMWYILKNEHLQMSKILVN